MKFKDCFATALRALLSNKLRSALTMLGILIGVAAVISVMSLGRAQETETQEAFASLGSNLIYVMPGPDVGMAGSSSSLTMEDAEAIAVYAPSVAMVSPVMQTTCQVVAGRGRGKGKTAGGAPDYYWVNNVEMEWGRFIDENDYNSRTRVAVLGNSLSETLFRAMNPVGQSVRLDGRKFNVVGVMESKGMGFGTEDQMVYIPLSTLQSTLMSTEMSGSGSSVQAITVQARSSDEIARAESEIESILRQRHRIREDEDNDFSVISMQAVSQIANQLMGILQIVLVAIAGISLLVGGIGIMNIMLVSVTERTREIGLRKAVGAKHRDILMQFLTEAAVLSFWGGVIGVALGWLIVWIASTIMGGMGFYFSAVIPGDVIALAVGVAVIVGIASGIYPAARAARLDPITALHHE